MNRFRIYSTDTQRLLVGSVLLETGNPPQLQVLDKGEAGKKLISTWNAIVSRPKLKLAESRSVPRSDGTVARSHGSRIVSPSDKDYVWAIYDRLEKEGGFSLEKFAEY